MSDNVDRRVPAALRERDPNDPLKHCVFTTLALLAWWAGPVVVSVMAVTGLLAYGRAIRRGQRKTRCWLRDTRLVVAYLAAALGVGLLGLVGLIG